MTFQISVEIAAEKTVVLSFKLISDGISQVISHFNCLKLFTTILLLMF